MPDPDDGFTEEAFKGLENDEQNVTPSTDPPKADDKKEGEDDANKDKPTDKPDGTAPSGEEKPTPGDGDKPTDPAQKPGTPEPAPTATPEAPQPLTKDDVTSIIRDIQTSERTSGKELETTTQEVIEAYYPDGLSNVLVDEKTGKELRTPQDVVEVSGGSLSTEEAAQWLMNEQYKLDNQINKIKNDARDIAETTVNFKRDSMIVLEKYDPLFKWQPHLQKKAFDLMMKQVKVDEKRGVILSAPDVMDLYDTYLEPYQQAYEFANKQSATNPTPGATPPTPKPSAEDRMDISGDGGQGQVDDPTDFAQQVTKELAKPL